jgi:hypothetical protein
LLSRASSWYEPLEVDADELDEDELLELAALGAPDNFGFVRMNLLPLADPLALPEVPVGAGSLVEAWAWLCSIHPVTVSWLAFGVSGSEVGGDCVGGVRVGGAPGTRGGCGA